MWEEQVEKAFGFSHREAQDGVEDVAIAGGHYRQSAQEADVGQDETQKLDQTCVCTYVVPGVESCHRRNDQ